METETTTRPTVRLQDSLILPDGIALGRDNGRGKFNGVDVFTRDELQAIVQQAHDVYDIAADPFATPGSADVQDRPVTPADMVRDLRYYGTRV